jgi:hypothetical protein
MPVLSRKPGERVVIGDNVTITVVAVKASYGLLDRLQLLQNILVRHQADRGGTAGFSSFRAAIRTGTPTLARRCPRPAWKRRDECGWARRWPDMACRFIRFDRGALGAERNSPGGIALVRPQTEIPGDTLLLPLRCLDHSAAATRPA